MSRIKQGDAAALQLFYDRHAPMAFGIALKITGDQTLAEEVLQETFWRVWQSASNDRPESGSLPGWLFRMVRTLAMEADGRVSSASDH